MKLLTFSLLLISLSSTSSQIAWERPFGGPTRPQLNDVVHGPDNFFYVCGKDSFPSTRAFLAKLDSAGNTLWEKTYSLIDSDYWFDHILLLDDTTLILQSASHSLVNGNYEVPQIVKIDTSGVILDKSWPDITGVYNATSNLLITPGTDHTFWTMLFIGTIGISNEIHITRWNDQLDTIHRTIRGGYYNYQYSFNSKGERAYDIFTEEYDTITHLITAPDHVSLYDTAGSILAGSVFFHLPPSEAILQLEDGGYNLYYPSYDSIVIRNFNSNHIQQYVRKYQIKGGEMHYGVVGIKDSSRLMPIQRFDHLSGHYVTSITKFDDDDDSLWTREFFYPHVNSLVSLHPTSDKGAIAIFNSSFYNDSLNFIVRLGPNGERFPFTINIYPHHYCNGDTVQLSVDASAASYAWTTGDTTPSIEVTSSGLYGLTVTDSGGNVHYQHPVSIQFDVLPPVLFNDTHICTNSITYTLSYPGAETYWVRGEYYSTSHQQTFSSNHIPDTIAVRVILHTQNGCSTWDSLHIYFDDCTLTNEISLQEELIIAQSAGKIHIRISTAKNIETVSLYDLTGRKISESRINHSFAEINMPATMGLYLIKCKTSSGILSGKILIKK